MEGCVHGLLEDGAGDVFDINLHVHVRVVDGDLLSFLVSRPADEGESRLVVGLRLAHVLGGDDDAVHAHILGLVRRVVAHEEGGVLRVDGNVTAARQGPLRVRIDARLNLGQRGPVDSHAAVLQANLHSQVGTDPDVGKGNCAHSVLVVGNTVVFDVFGHGLRLAEDDIAVGQQEQACDHGDGSARV